LSCPFRSLPGFISRQLNANINKPAVGQVGVFDSGHDWCRMVFAVRAHSVPHQRKVAASIHVAAGDKIFSLCTVVGEVIYQLNACFTQGFSVRASARLTDSAGRLMVSYALQVVLN